MDVPVTIRRYAGAAFFGLLREELSPVLGVALTPGVSPRCQASGGCIN